jgi:CheY-like chemotaxis protein
VPFSVLIVDDDPAIVWVLALLVDGEADLSVAGTAADGERALAWVRQQCPDAIISDHRMPHLTGLQALPQLRRTCPGSVIVLNTSDTEITPEALSLGADAVWDKADPPGRLINLVRTLCSQKSE